MGFSEATVSLALRSHPQISSATKAGISRLVRKHNYVLGERVSELMRSIHPHASDGLTGCPGLISLHSEKCSWLAASRHGHLGQIRASVHPEGIQGVQQNVE